MLRGCIRRNLIFVRTTSRYMVGGSFYVKERVTMIFYVNDNKWILRFISPNNGNLRRSDGIYTLGVTDNEIKAIYIATGLSDAMLDKVLCHELCHAYCFEYDLSMDLQTEEIVADFLATYGRSVIFSADEIIGRIGRVVA